MTQPKAIFLAEVLEAEPRSAAHHDAAAAELRRLHDIEKAYASACEFIDEQDKKLVELERRRDALLEALGRMVLDGNCPDENYRALALNQARAAIKAVEDGK